jgi:hypothetical protein
LFFKLGRIQKDSFKLIFLRFYVRLKLNEYRCFGISSYQYATKNEFSNIVVAFYATESTSKLTISNEKNLEEIKNRVK